MTPNADIRAAESLLAFWADAGVEASYADAPIDRMAEGLAQLSARRAAVSAAIAPSAARVPVKPAGPDISQALAQARALAAAAPDLEALAAAIAGFDGCALKFEGASQSVFSRGRPDAPLMIIGEGPGGDEDRQGEPFVGRAGKLLDRMLTAAGLQDQVFITNTVFWRPPGNRTPTPAEQAVCAPFLHRAIQLVGPRMLLLAGAAAAKSVLRSSEGILAMRGRWFDWKAEEGDLELPALPTLHPAFLLRQPAAKKKAWADMLMLSERLSRPHRSPEEGA
ncbi:MAG: uracil-DNA glycosylase [Caulobacter sp.]|nr:uracil-DNA glycosylase [Caulobacter sp.]